MSESMLEEPNKSRKIINGKGVQHFEKPLTENFNTSLLYYKAQATGRAGMNSV